MYDSVYFVCLSVCLSARSKCAFEIELRARTLERCVLLTPLLSAAWRPSSLVWQKCFSMYVCFCMCIGSVGVCKLPNLTQIRRVGATLKWHATKSRKINK